MSPILSPIVQLIVQCMSGSKILSSIISERHTVNVNMQIEKDRKKNENEKISAMSLTLTKHYIRSFSICMPGLKTVVCMVPGETVTQFIMLKCVIGKQI